MSVREWLAECLLGEATASNFENRFITGTSLATALMGVTSAVNSYALGLPTSVVLSTLVVTLTYFLIFLLSRLLERPGVGFWLIFAISLLFLGHMWFANGGSSSPSIYFYCPLVALSALALDKRQRRWAFFGIIGDIAFLFWLESRFPQWLVPYAHSKSRLFDFGVSIGLCLLTLYYMVSYARDAYRERKEAAENALKESRLTEDEVQRAFVAIENSLTALTTSNERGLIYANPAAVRLWGYDSLDDLKKVGTERLFVERCQEKQSVIRKATHCKGIYFSKGGELFGRRKDGTEFELAFSTVASKEEKEEDVVLTSSWIDLTDQKKAERALEESETRYRQLVEVSSAWVWEVNREGCYCFVSPQVEEILGYSPGEMIGKRPYDFMPREEARRIKRIFGNERRQMRSFRKIEMVYRHKDGRPMILESSGITRFDESENYLGYRGMDYDVTERKAADKALEESERKYRGVIENMASVFYRTDQNGIVTILSSSGVRLLGYADESEVLGRSILEHYVDPRDREIFLAILKRDGVVYNYNTHLKRRDGMVITVATTSRLTRDSSGQYDGVEGVFTDISEIQKTHYELILAKKQAEMANMAKSTFLANMSHEIRTPMNGIIGMSELLSDTELNVEQRDYVSTIRSCANSLLSIIDEILDFSKIEAQKLRIQKKEFNLLVILEDIEDLISVQTKEKKLEFNVDVDNRVPQVMIGDPGRIRQIIINLLGNAVKFTERGSVGLRVRLEREVADNVIVRFEVKDSGIGIPKEKQGQLFQAFMQVDDSYTRKFGGTGLGLAISKQLAKLMGGQIGFESDELNGSTFWFTVQLMRQSVGIGSEEKESLMAGARILVVDDNPMTLETLKLMTRKWSARFETAGDAASAIEKLLFAANEGRPFQIVIIDRIMPDVGGEELGRMIEADARLKNTRLVLMGKSGEIGDAEKYYSMGFSGFVLKPVKLSQLKACLLQTLGVKAGDAVVRRKARAGVAGSLRILLAEDNATNQKVTRILLEKWGHEVEVVNDGREALESLEKQDFDVVLMDVQMPEMDGTEATRQFRQSTAERNKGIPIIALTAHAMGEDKEKCLASGMNDYLSKPIEPRNLGEILEKWSSGRFGSKEGGKAPVDFANLVERLGGDEGAAQEVIGVYLKDLPRQIALLREAVASGDSAEVRSCAHKIRGASANVGAKGISQLAAELEQEAREGKLSQAQDLLGEIESHYSRIKVAFLEEPDAVERVGG